MSLSLFIAVDNHFCSHLVIQALVNDETKETYEWLLTSTLQATNHAPRVFITNADPGMDAAIDSQYSDVYPLHCIYHISQNLMHNLKVPLGISYNDFAKDFYLCRNDLSPTGFDIQWSKLITTYPKAANYLNSELYSSKEKWAKAYITKFFTAGISSTFCIESENSVIKNVLQGRPSLCELATILDLRLKDEAQYVNYNEWYYTNASAQLSGAFAECFPEIDRILKKYLTEEMLSRQRHKIIQSLYYHTIIETGESLDNKHVEESYDTQQIHLTSLLEDLPPNDIIKTYKVQRRHCVNVNFVIILDDRSHLCTCMLLVNFGLICQHFWHIFSIDNNAFFHVTLISRHWYNNEKMQDLCLDEQPYMMNTGSVQNEDCLCPLLFQMCHITKIHDYDVFGSEVCRTVQKRRDYGETFNLVRKAVRSAVEAIHVFKIDFGFLSIVEAGGESLYRLKKSLNDWLVEEQKLVEQKLHIKDNDKENFDLGQVENPIERRQKGRPPVKRFKSSTEQFKNKKSQNKCGKCGVIGHYAPTCKQ
ncbi:hypothetical protein Glove_291g37 [Diversispora epigaea]|uniref:MULE transposase domain-containing protein n=1 Tax=Diversispora epigaea TaxID=1348612 RepID=A0A397I0G2_9GLOM|nr:hypothetical protein Glove_291g37 [Diversispora epigaea]